MLSVLIISSVPLVAGTYDDRPDPSKHFVMLDMDAPRANRVEVCHAYTCQRKTRYEFTSANITEITSLMRKTKRNDSPAEEGRAIAYAIGLMEKQAGAGLGIHDKAGMQWTVVA